MTTTPCQIGLWLTPDDEENLLRAQYLKIKLVLADVSSIVLWLVAADSRMCNSQLWVVDGGRI